MSWPEREYRVLGAVQTPGRQEEKQVAQSKQGRPHSTDKNTSMTRKRECEHRTGTQCPTQIEKTESSDPSTRLVGRRMKNSYDSQACGAVRAPLCGALGRDGTDLVVLLFIPIFVRLRLTGNDARCLARSL